jgi:hypothetical protein
LNSHNYEYNYVYDRLLREVLINKQIPDVEFSIDLWPNSQHC